MKIDDIAAFAAVVRCRSLSQAGRELGLTQPAVTRRVQNFEEALGVELLDRNTKPPKPTPLGLRVHEQCRAVLREVDALRDLVAADLAPSGGLRLGLTQGIGELALLPLLADLRAQWPELAPQVATDWGGRLLERVERGELDAAAIFLPHGNQLPRGIEGEVLATTRLVVVAPQHEPARRRLRLADCAERGWVLNPDGCGFREGLRRALAALGMPLKVNLDTYARELQLQGVVDGLGLGLVPLPLFERSRWRALLQVLPLSDFQPGIDLWLLHGRLPGRLQAPLARVGVQIAALLQAGAAPARKARRT